MQKVAESKFAKVAKSKFASPINQNFVVSNLYHDGSSYLDWYYDFGFGFMLLPEKLLLQKWATDAL